MPTDPVPTVAASPAGFRLRGVGIVAIFAVAGLLSMFLRSSHSAIAPEIMRDLALGAEALSVMTSAYFFAYSLSQPLVGILLDRFGPRLTVPGGLVLAVLGALVFGAAHSLETSFLGRFLMGLGCAPIFMGAFVVTARWFAPERFGTVAGVISAVGYGGNMVAATPMALASLVMGWRWAFAAIAVAAVAVGLALLVVVRDAPPGHPAHAHRPESLSAVARGVGQVLANRQMHRLLAIAVTCYSVIAAVFTLWAGPYLNDVFGLDGVARGNVLLAMALATVVGSFAYGSLDRVFNTRKGLVLAGSGSSVVVLLVMALWPEPGVAVASALLTLFGLVSAFGVVVTVHCRSLFPDHMAGRAMTTANLVMTMSAALVQTLTGLIVGAFPTADGLSPSAAYRAVFLFLAAITVAAMLIYRGIADVRPGDPRPGA
ncbi:MAG: MFS transporter [Proteobacteria bacterium]|nr:MFS transporter [Pseudomonadota bacterium]